MIDTFVMKVLNLSCTSAFKFLNELQVVSHDRLIIVLALTQCPVGILIFRDHFYIEYSRGCDEEK